MTTAKITFEFSVRDGVSVEWLAESLFDVPCNDVDDLVPNAVDSVDGYDFRIDD